MLQVETKDRQTIRIHCAAVGAKAVRTVCPLRPPAVATGVQSTALGLLWISYSATSEDQRTATSTTW
eukprot:Skav223554  [mRNA]  locus=scaffold1657:527391:528220:+ [translate_table: standard]